MILKDKIIIVTGGSGLIGREIVDDIKRKGGYAINADINVSTDLSNGTINVDVSDSTSIRNAVEEIYTYFGHIDGLVNSAYPRTKDWGAFFEDINPVSWKQNVDMQMNSCFEFCQYVLRYMAKEQKGAIVNIASIYGIVGNDFTLYEEYGGTSPAAYSAIKGGIINFTRYLASYYGRKNIRVNCVSPGGIFDHQHESFLRRYNEKVPMGRMGNPDDIAPAVSFLLSDEAKYITGQNLAVDGGWTAI
ncbi:SDR family oxidoreductase [Parabacteroides sp. GYB001]|uniref:SDR family oxidoreductase n=1 Tax=Parabacteroides leei TaxID=2939491 RepID=UPI0020183B60|nr:SDR family oxidoreductase [Parabacteroides leei]MCL3852154.1 SDR family oxidoreductase [Parabacteroides leei]